MTFPKKSKKMSLILKMSSKIFERKDMELLPIMIRKNRYKLFEEITDQWT